MKLFGHSRPCAFVTVAFVRKFLQFVSNSDIKIASNLCKFWENYVEKFEVTGGTALAVCELPEDWSSKRSHTLFSTLIFSFLERELQHRIAPRFKAKLASDNPSIFSTWVTQFRRSKKTKMNSERLYYFQVATISANNESSIGSLIAEAMKRVGKDGVITIEDGNSYEDELEVVTVSCFNEWARTRSKMLKLFLFGQYIFTKYTFLLHNFWNSWDSTVNSSQGQALKAILERDPNLTSVLRPCLYFLESEEKMLNTLGKSLKKKF